MQVKVYVNYIFPAYCGVDEKTGEIGCPMMTDHIINSKLFFWLFDLISFLLSLAWVRDGNDPMFECKVVEKDRVALKEKWPNLY